MQPYKFLLVILLLSTSPGIKAQSINYSKDLVIQHFDTYHNEIKKHPETQLVEILPAKTGIRLDIRYATSNNFMHQPMYSQARAFARLPVYNALIQIQSELKKQGLGLKIFDCYRPYNITVKFYEMARDTSFVADPRKGSRHNRGCAVDLTIINLNTNKELEMPTGYDSFLPAAAANYDKASTMATNNRKLLQTVMIAHGFNILPSEWWHFDYAGWQDFALLDIPFSQL